MERNNRTILVILIAIVITVAVFSSFGLPLFTGPTPTITLPTPVPAVTLGPSGTQQEEGARVEVTPATVQSVIAVMDRLESYSRSVTTTLEGISATARVWVDGAWTRADMELPDHLTAHTIVGEGKVWRWYGNDREVASWPADGSSVDVEGQRIPTYEDVLELETETITAAGYEEKNGEACVYVEVSVPELSQTERFWVSADTGLLTAAETLVGDEVVYTMTAAALESPVAATASFTLPDGTVLHTVGEAVQQ
ncbi:MAG: hypothetical protein HFF06_02275 [Oscillospiraceae bacterium]|nr:hypothetical protein [Oscillospiraceae bacterium]